MCKRGKFATKFTQQLLIKIPHPIFNKSLYKMLTLYSFVKVLRQGIHTHTYLQSLNFYTVHNHERKRLKHQTSCTIKFWPLWGFYNHSLLWYRQPQANCKYHKTAMDVYPPVCYQYQRPISRLPALKRTAG